MAVCLVFLLPVNVQAASKLRSKFDHKASGNIYYYDKKGKTVKGLVKIRGKKYYFNDPYDNNGRYFKGNYISCPYRRGRPLYLLPYPFGGGRGTGNAV